MKKLFLILLFLTPLTSCSSNKVEVKLISHIINNSNNSYILKSSYKYIIDCYEIETINSLHVIPSISYDLKVNANANETLKTHIK